MSRNTVTLLTLVTLLSGCYAAPRPLMAEELAAAGLNFPALEKRAENTTDSSWFPRFGRRQYDVASPLPTAGQVKVATTKKASSTKSLCKASTTQKKPSTTTQKKATTTSKATAKTTAPSVKTTAKPHQYPVPASVQSLYNQLAGGKHCTNVLDTNPHGYQMNGDGGNYAHYCGTTKTNPEVVFWMSNMDIDCDGATKSGACGNDPSHESQTAFEYNNKPLDALSVPYVVINDDKYFNPSKFGIEGLATVGVVCGGKLTWAVVGDTNGLYSMGEGSLSLAQACFPDQGLNGNNGYDPATVLYFAFTGKDAVDPYGGSNFGQLAARGNSLLSRL